MLARDHAAALGYEGEVFAAAEGATIELRGTPTARTRRSRLAGAMDNPALEEVGQSVLLAVRNPEIATILREPARHEGLEIWETTDQDEAVEIARARLPAIVVLEDTRDGRAVQNSPERSAT